MNENKNYSHVKVSGKDYILVNAPPNVVKKPTIFNIGPYINYDLTKKYIEQHQEPSHYDIDETINYLDEDFEESSITGQDSPNNDSQDQRQP